VKALGSAGQLTALTGAGISAESGLPTFRGAGGLWEGRPVEEVATPEAYARQPRLVLDFYNARRRQLQQVAPNPAHLALARLEAAFGDRFTLITQNVDDLHERAGSRRVLHMHGELLRARCAHCSHLLRWTGDITTEDACELCGGPIRPHIVWFGEAPFFMEEEIPRALEAEVFLSIGTSGTVYPAAGFVSAAKLAGSFTVEVNLEPSDNAPFFDLRIAGEAGKKLPALVEALVKSCRGGRTILE
jgi:NAD-dependent deacetylase